MKADFVNPLQLSLLNELSTMTQLELKPGKPKRKMDELARGDVLGLIDMVGEITNMVTGGAKRILGEKGYKFNMATPVIVSGPNHAITHRADGTKIMMPFESDFGRATIEICFDE